MNRSLEIANASSLPDDWLCARGVGDEGQFVVERGVRASSSSGELDPISVGVRLLEQARLLKRRSERGVRRTRGSWQVTFSSPDGDSRRGTLAVERVSSSVDFRMTLAWIA
jgi:hypothetical protein